MGSGKDLVNRRYKYSFARQFLADHKTKIFRGGEQILTPPPEQLYTIKLPNTRYFAGDIFIKKGETKKINSYEQLKELGFHIESVKIKDNERWDAQQSVKYVLRRKDSCANPLGKMPHGKYPIHAEYDSYNQIVRLVGPRAGPMGVGPWVTLKHRVRSYEKRVPKELEYQYYGLRGDDIIEDQMRIWMDEDPEPQPIEIPEGAFMITDANEIVCFPNSPDMPSILIAGMKGQGKSTRGTDTVLMSDGTLKQAKDIKVGDKVISPQHDGSTVISTVLHTTSWLCDDVYEIRELNRTKKLLYTCSGNHMIPLNKHIIPRVKGIKRLDLTMNQIRHNTAAEYSKFSKGYKEKCTTPLSPEIKQYEGRNNPEIDPYLLGLWLGDGSFTTTLTITNNNKEIGNYLKENTNIMGIYTQKGCPHFRYSTVGTFANQLKKLGLHKHLSGNKFIPECVLYADSDYRKKVLAGIIDTEGYSEKGSGYVIVLKSKKFVEGIVRIVHSLGGRCGEIRTIKKKCQNNFEGTYYSLSLYLGDKSKELPLLIEYKKKKHNAFYLSPNRVSIDAIKTKPEVVYGFIIDSQSQWFIINDFVVTHNSYCLHSLVSRFFWKPEFSYKMIIVNDSSRECGTWCMPNSDKAQIMTLKRLNERPLPLPVVYLHPMVKEDYEKLHMDQVGFDITIPFKEIVEHYDDYLEIEGSKRYMARLKDELLQLKTVAQVETFLESISLSHNVPVNTANKIRAEFESLFDKKMTDISVDKQDPWSTSKAPNRFYNPLTAAVHAGLLPVLETEYVANDRKMLSIYFTYFVKDLFIRQKQDPDFVKQKAELMFVVDECHNISMKGIKSAADLLLRRCVREGRPRRIGTMLATQKFSELPDIIKDNTTYLICFKNPGEASEIANQYKMGKVNAEVIANLEKHECVAYTTEYFIVYDREGNQRKSKANEIFKGKTLPPFSLHKRPRTEATENRATT